MTITSIIQETKTQAPALQVTHMDEVVETIRDDTLALAREKLYPFERSLDPAVLFRRPDFVGRFMFALAAQVAHTLAAHDQRVLAVYVHDPSANPPPEAGEEVLPDSTMHLLVLVTAPSAALSAFIASLDRALAASLRELTPLFAQHESVMDVALIAEADVRLGRGLAGMLSAVFAPPIKVWQRER